MINRAWGKIIKGKTFYATNWYIDELELNQPLCKIPGWTVPNEWLTGMFDERMSGELMPMPIDRRN